jgi:C1A family cysteine protease
LDWRNKSGVTGVKYQSTCAADWAFAATAYAESKLAIDSKG